MGTPHRESPTPSMPVQALTQKEKQEIKELIEQFVFSSTGAQCPVQKACRGIAKKYLSDDKTRYEHCRPDIKAIVKEVRRLYKRHRAWSQCREHDARQHQKAKRKD